MGLARRCSSGNAHHNGRFRQGHAQTADRKGADGWRKTRDLPDVVLSKIILRKRHPSDHAMTDQTPNSRDCVDSQRVDGGIDLKLLHTGGMLRDDDARASLVQLSHKRVIIEGLVGDQPVQGDAVDRRWCINRR